MLSSLLSRIAGSVIPLRVVGLAVAGVTIAGAIAYHLVTVTKLETAVAQAQAAQAEAMADAARRDAAIGEMERGIAMQNAAVARLQADGKVRENRAAAVALRELSQPTAPVPQDVAALNAWIRHPEGDR